MYGHHHHSHRGHRHGCGSDTAPGSRDGWERGGWGRGRGGPMDGRMGGPGGRGRGRPFEPGDLRLLVLQLVGEQPRHGYEIIKAIEEALGGAYSPSPGVIYPTLTLLEETGLVTAETQGAKKLYSLTDEGRRFLETEAPQAAAARERFDEARRRFGAGPPPEVVRAMTNLRHAMQVRLDKGPLAPEALDAITAALDRAAAEVERSWRGGSDPA